MQCDATPTPYRAGARLVPPEHMWTVTLFQSGGRITPTMGRVDYDKPEMGIFLVETGIFFFTYDAEYSNQLFFFQFSTLGLVTEFYQTQCIIFLLSSC